MPHFFITGISGFMGSRLAAHLLSLGEQVSGVDLADFDYLDMASQVAFRKGDVRDAALMKEMTRGADVVVHAAAALPLSGKEEIRSTNVEGTRTVLEACLKNKVPRVIFISSTAVYGIPKIHPVDENAPLHGVGPYGESKIAAERLCEEYRQKGLCVSVLRTKTFAGPYRLGVFHILCDWVHSKKNIPIIGNGKNAYQLLHIYDLVDVIHLLAKADKQTASATYNVGSTQFTTMGEDMQALLDHAGFGKHVRPIPYWMAVPPLKAMEAVHLSPLYQWVYETADKDHVVSCELLMRALDWKPKYSTAKVWIDTYDWYAANRDSISKTGTTHRVAWKQGLLSVVKLFF